MFSSELIKTWFYSECSTVVYSSSVSGLWLLSMLFSWISSLSLTSSRWSSCIIYISLPGIPKTGVTTTLEVSPLKLWFYSSLFLLSTLSSVYSSSSWIVTFYAITSLKETSLISYSSISSDSRITYSDGTIPCFPT